MINLDNKKVIVGMSGGVDSSVCALLLKEAGYDVSGVALKLYQPEDDIIVAEKTCELLGINFSLIDARKLFEAEVLKNFKEEYSAGRTPNPCLRCNPLVKWKLLLDEADKIGAYYVATGHYACIKEIDGTYYVARATDLSKDQSYALCMLPEDALKRSILPLGAYSKLEIRVIASEHNLPSFEAPDSEDLCFAGSNYSEIFDADKEGNFVDTNGNILGRHKGISHYTVGQRRGLGIAAGDRTYVIKIDPLSNDVVLGELDDLNTSSLTCHNINVISDFPDGQPVFFKIRYNHKGECGNIYKTSDGGIRCEFDNPVRAVAPGQSAVFYSDDLIIAGGTID